MTDSTVSSLEYSARLRGERAADRGVEGAEPMPKPATLPGGLPTLRLWNNGGTTCGDIDAKLMPDVSIVAARRRVQLWTYAALQVCNINYQVNFDLQMWSLRKSFHLS